MNRTTSFLPASLGCLMAACAATAFAAPPTYTKGDLLMGFRVTGGTGTGQCYLVNIGQASIYRDATTPITVGTLGNINADLSGAYGAGWQARTDLQWGIACSPDNLAAFGSDPAAALYLSRTQATVNSPGTLPFIDSETTRTGVSTRINALQSGFYDTVFNSGTPGVSDHTANSNVAAFQADTDTYAWRQYMSTGGNSTYTPGNSDFGSGLNIEANATKTLSLFRFVDNNPASYEGYFAISSTGVLTFTPFAVQSYASWAAANNVTGTNSGAAEDFDQDGIPNGVEFFMGTSPTAFTANPTPVNRLVLWPRAAGRDSTPVVQVSTNLVDWSPATTGVNIGATSVTYTLPPDQPAQFVRLKVTP